jgi:transcriptional regulator with XRE-family HTH domain
MQQRKRLGERLRRLRQEAGLTLSELARAIGSGKQTLSDLELGKGARPPDRRLISRFVDTCLAQLALDKVLLQERSTSVMAEYTLVVQLIELAADHREGRLYDQAGGA